jgi:hypothetical protein
VFHDVAYCYTWDMTQPVRVAEDLFESARRVGAAQERSAAQQLSHWARIGRELESSSALTFAEYRGLADAAAYDDLAPAQQALVRAQRELAIAETAAGLDLRSRFVAEGKEYVVVGDDAGRARRVKLSAQPKPKAEKRAAAQKKARARAKS